MKAQIELTDTFGGEANYSWVKRSEWVDVTDLTDRQIVRKMKALVDLTGVKCDKEDWHDVIKLTIRGTCVVAFINFDF